MTNVGNDFDMLTLHFQSIASCMTAYMEGRGGGGALLNSHLESGCGGGGGIEKDGIILKRGHLICLIFLGKCLIDRSFQMVDNEKGPCLCSGGLREESAGMSNEIKMQ